MPEENGISKNLELIYEAIVKLDEKIEAQGKRINFLEQRAGFSVTASAQLDQQQTFSNLAMPPLPPPPSESAQESGADLNSQTPQSFAGVTSSELPRDSSQTSLEENIGGKWFARIGIAALVIGISFFLKYAFDNDWIGETGRVIIGIFAGLVLLALGEKTIRKYQVYGQILSGGGIAVLYLSIFSAFNFYHIISSASAFLIMIVITAIGIAISLRYDALALLMVAIIGGFATPFMASSGENHQVLLLSYIMLLDLAILTISIFKRWHSLNIIGFIGTVILFAGWGEKFYTSADLGSTMFFLTLFFLIYSISSLIYNLVRKEKSTGVEQILTLFSATAYFATSYALLNDEYHAFLGFFALLLGIYYFLWAYLVRALTPEDGNLYGFLAFLTAGFVTLAIPIQFEQNIITIGWVVEAVLLMIIGLKTTKKSMVAFSIIVWVLALLRFFFFDIAEYDRNTMLLCNEIFLTAIVIIIASYLMAYAIRRLTSEGDFGTDRKMLMIIFVIIANFMMIFSISKEIDESYARNIDVLRVALEKSETVAMQRQPGALKPRYGEFYGSEEYKTTQNKINKLENKNSISLSLFWLAYAIILLAVGIIGKSKNVRLGGIALLLLAILKLFFMDLWSLGTLYRIISSISLGVVLLSISFVYQKYKDSLKEII